MQSMIETLRRRRSNILFYARNMGAADQIDDSSSNSKNDGEVDGHFKRGCEGEGSGVLTSIQEIFTLLGFPWHISC